MCWDGDGREFRCHLKPGFLRKGVDVIVNASSVEDIDAGAIGQRLSNGLARLSSPVLHRLRLREDENAEPVVSVCLGQAGPSRALPAWPSPESDLQSPYVLNLCAWGILGYPACSFMFMPGCFTLQGTTYQKTDAAVEMKRINREQFWEQAKVWDPDPGLEAKAPPS